MHFEAPRFIGLTGAKRSGKDTAAKALIRHFDYRRAPFAGGLKAMLETLLSHQGVDPVTIERMIEGDLKEEPSEFLGGRSMRHAMQMLGTEWGRDRMAHDLWLGVWERRIVNLSRVVVTDVRFDNEAEKLRARGGVIIQVLREGQEPANDNHISERPVSPNLIHLRLLNNFDTAAGFEEHVRVAVGKFLRLAA